MCGRYTITETDSLGERYEVEVPGGENLANYNAAPTQNLPTIVSDGDGKRLEIMRWGFVPSWSKDAKIGYKLINARSETIFDKPMWKKAILTHRCLIPASGFYEWQKQSSAGKQPFFIHPRAGGLFSFAGVWGEWHDPHDTSGKPVRTYSILTTAPNQEMTAIHDRMPVILHPGDEASWLNPDMSEAQDIEQYLRPLEDGSLEMFAVSTDVNNVRVNEARLMGRSINARLHS